MKTRRVVSVLALSVLLIASMSLVAFGEYNESPVLQELVKSGQLPPVAERLPKEPAVIEPIDEIGQYGGTWERAWTGPSDRSGLDRLTSSTIIECTLDGQDVQPSLAKGWDICDEAKVFTYYLREGLRWSDGAPFTADDIMFWYYDVALNDQLSPGRLGWAAVQGEQGTLEKIDDYTVRFVFAHPNPIFPQRLAWGNEQYMPKHYLKQFHMDYGDAAQIEEMARLAGFDNWQNAFHAKADWLVNLELPSMRPWIPVTSATESRHRMVRNPYFWKVDPEGNQLPYIDEVVHTLAESAEVINLMGLAGDLDMQVRHMSLVNYPSFMANRERGGYRVVTWRPALAADPGITLNLTHRDEGLREIINNVMFRRALSVAIDREEINELMFYGLGVPRAATVPSSSPHFVPEFEQMYAQFDRDQANAWLDEAGLAKRDSEGFRLRPDGKRLEITIDTISYVGPWIEVGELVAEYWNEVGVRTQLRVLERSLFFARVNANEIDASAWSIDWSLHLLVTPRRYVPQSPNGSRFAPAIGTWLATGGTSGEPPWGDLEKVLDLYEEAIVTADAIKRESLVREILRINAENVWTIGTVGETPSTLGIGIVKDYFKNVPNDAVSEGILSTPANTQPAQYYMIP